MIVTVTPNPSFDRTAGVDHLEAGEVQSVTSTSLEAGGKGINVARALARAGHRARSVFPAGTADGGELCDLLSDVPDLDITVVDTATRIRTNLTIIESSGRTTKLNEPGPTLDDHHAQNLLGCAAAVSDGVDWIVGSGSLAPGLPIDFYGRLVESVRGSTTRVAVDSTGDVLRHAVEAGCDLIKPNHEELEGFVGRTLPTLGDVVDAAQDVRSMGVATVLVSLGGHGAVLVEGDQVTFGAAPSAVVANTVGAGDSFLAGFLACGGSGKQGLREALAFGYAKVRSATTDFAPATDADRDGVSTTEAIDRTREVGSV
ncbi:MAG: 1-phosphofructokinase family hexose kinase [Acidimicrobiales bacterium]